METYKRAQVVFITCDGLKSLVMANVCKETRETYEGYIVYREEV